MPPTIFIINSECDNVDIKKNHPNKDVQSQMEIAEGDVGHRVKRKLDNYHLCNDGYQNKRRRISEATTLSSTNSSDSDEDYGTDTELIDIDLHKNLSKRQGHIAERIIEKVENGNEKLIDASIFQIINDEQTSFEDIFKRLKHTRIGNSNTRQLFEIALKTFQLSRKNKELNIKLNELKMDAKEFLSSVLNNPENLDIKERLNLVF